MTGRHDKTLELTAAGSITARATCILAVSAGPLPGELPLLRERVRLTLAAGDVSAVVEGEVNPGWHSAESLVVRRSGQLDPDTYLVNATAAAADLPAGLLAALRDPAATVEVTAEELGTPTPVVLVLTGGPVPDEIARLAAQADLVVDLTGRGSPAPPVPLPGPRRTGCRTAVTGRTTVVLTDDPSAALPVTAREPGRALAAGPRRRPAAVRRPARRRRCCRPAASPPPPPPGPSSPGCSPAPRPRPPSTPPAPTSPPLPTWHPSTPSSRPTRRPGLGGPRCPCRPGRPERAASARAGPARPLSSHGRPRPTPMTDPGLRAAPGRVAGRRAGDRGSSWWCRRGTSRWGWSRRELARVLRAAGRSGRDTAAVLTGLGVPRREAYRLAADPARDPR